jgi:hypothetical protein
MRKSYILLAVLGAISLMVPASGQCATVTKTLESVAGIDVYGPLTTSVAPDSPQWVLGNGAEALSPVPIGWANPTAANSVLSTAIWITPPYPLDTTKPYSMFSDSLTVNLPCTGYNFKGTVYTTANNSEDVYANDSNLGTASDPTQPSSFDFTPTSDENTFDFIVETGATTDQTGPIGLIYKAVISYDLPDVVWRPPIVNSNRTLLKAGTTLPVKFVLKENNKALHTAQNIYVAVTGTEGQVARFDIGQGSTGLRFAKGNGQYITNFKTKDYTLNAGEQYTISVNDGCSGDILGSVQITIQGKKTHGNH